MHDDKTAAKILDDGATILVGDLTPISLKEAKSILGNAINYASDNDIASAILDFTAIARAFFRTIPKFNDGV